MSALGYLHTAVFVSHVDEERGRGGVGAVNTQNSITSQDRGHVVYWRRREGGMEGGREGGRKGGREGGRSYRWENGR